MRWAGHLLHMRYMKNAFIILVGKSKGDYFAEIDVDGKI
jgi:hypothetical protein